MSSPKQKAPDQLPEYYQGWRSYVVGNLNNPHRPNTLKARNWEHGWNRAYFDNLRKIEAA